MSREAMQMALEALELHAEQYPHMQKGYTVDAITALRERLAQPEQEPVAWMHNFIEGNVITHIPADIGRHPERWTPLYTSPPNREWVGLTEEEIQDLGYLSEKFDASHSEWFDRWGFARAIEAKLKEKNT